MTNPALSQSPKLAEQSLPAVVRKSRDSGFVGSLDDLLRRDAGGESTPTGGASSCNMGSSDSGHSLSDGEGSTSASNSGGATTTPSVVSSASKRQTMQLEKVDEENLATDGAATTSSSQASSPCHAPSTPPTTTNLNLQATSKEAAVEQSLDSSPENHPESFARSNPARARVIQPRYASLLFSSLLFLWPRHF